MTDITQGSPKMLARLRGPIVGWIVGLLLLAGALAIAVSPLFSTSPRASGPPASLTAGLTASESPAPATSAAASPTTGAAAEATLPPAPTPEPSVVVTFGPL